MVLKTRFKNGLVISLLTLLALQSCLKPGNNDQDTDASLYYLNESFRTWYNALFSYRGPAVPMGVMADQITWDFGNFTYAQKFGGEPRQPFANFYKSPDTYFIDRFWIGSYEALNYVNLTLSTLNQGGTITGMGQDDEPMIRAWCYFLQGTIHGYLGLVFDKAVIQDEYADPYNPVLSAWPEVIGASVSFLNKSIQTAQQNDFVLPENWYSGEILTSGDLAAIASTFTAMFMAYAPRNAAQNDTVNWSAVVDYTRQGITKDFSVFTDNQQWINSQMEKAFGHGFGRIDNRIIHLFDTTYPARYPASGQPPDPPEAVSQDARLTSDFEYIPTINFAPENGTYLFSNYRLSRYDTWLTDLTGILPFVMKTENDLLRAEALARTGNITEAVSILNAGPRMRRGNLSMLDPGNSPEQVLDIVCYEREIELTGTGMGTDFYDMRRRDMLQKGTLLHFPVPAEELEIMGLPVYSFGGEDHADGINTSDGGW